MNKQNPDSRKEEWRDIPGYGNYQVSDQGRVRRVGKSVLKPKLKNSGYLFVTLRDNGKRKNHYVHGLVALVFIGVRPFKADVNHINGDKLDNRAFNLEYVSRAENMRHARECGLHNNYADGHYNAKLSSELVKEIRWAHSVVGLSAKEIAPSLGVHENTIDDVLKNRTWRSVE